jgi:hypothetical protein
MRTPSKPSPLTRVVWTLFLLQVCVPTILLLDCLISVYKEGAFSTATKLFLCFTLAWLVASGLLLALGIRRAQVHQTLSPYLLIVYSIMIGWGATEILLRAWLSGQKTERTQRLFPPGKYPVTAERSGTVTINALGVRGPALKAGPDAYRIVTVGGSTTQCLELDDSEVWPQLLMDGLNKCQLGRSVWVGNAGVEGHGAVQHLRLLQRLPLFQKADLVIFLVGINDLQVTLSLAGAPSQEILDRAAQRFLDEAYVGLVPFHLNRALFSQSWVYQFAVTPVRHYLSNRQPTMRQQDATKRIASLPDLRCGLLEYRERIIRIVQECRNRNLRCLILTQPTLWHQNLPSAAQDRVRGSWFAMVGRQEDPKGYLSSTDSTYAMNLWNRTLLDACHQSDAECFDLAAHVPKEVDLFLDECHFTAAGSRVVAGVLTSYLATQPPFKQVPSLKSGQ